MVATYRLQLEPSFGFEKVRELIPYFQKLGISHLYFSPITAARMGSTHGYDVVDHNRIWPELGGREAFDQLLSEVQEAGLELLLDFVPNHAGIGPRNENWHDVLAYGPHSPFARYFDVDWNPLKNEIQGKVLLPFLGGPYGEVFDRGEIKLQYLEGRIYATYFDNRWAISPATYADILETGLARYERTDTYWDLKDLIEQYRGLEPHERDKAETLRPRFDIMTSRIAIDEILEAVPSDVLHRVLEQQFWRLSYWKTAGHEINYRRFFDINGLIGLRMEDAHVFWDAHRLLSELLAKKGICGVRIDHVDGLFDPHLYLRSLRDLGALHVWVEKILAAGETLPADWPVEGTSGYEFLNDVMGLLVQPEGELPLDRIYRRFVPESRLFADVVYESKRLVMGTSLANELNRLAYELDRISEADYHTRDFTLEGLRDALAHVVASFDRYRTYLPYDAEQARDVVQKAIYRAQQRTPASEQSVFAFLLQAIMGEVREDLVEEQRAWVGRFQQYTAPVAAKGVEDTAFYRYIRLVALNEVGGEPGYFSQNAQAFHSHARGRAHKYPRNLLATATHDHKRGEDTRMRMIAIAEVPDQWDAALTSLDEIARTHRSDKGPSRTDEYLFYQILAGLWHGADRETLVQRITDYMLKASRESKIETSWQNQDEAYEQALTAFISGMLGDERLDGAFSPLAQTLAQYGFWNTLSQVVIKFTSPGVPDIYQGCELFDLSLVDPDNRRPVDYDRRMALLDEFESLLSDPKLEPLQGLIDATDERAKFYITVRLLRLRRAFPRLFEGGYRPLEVSGNGQNHWIAYAREEGDDAVVVVVPRFPATLEENREASIALPEAWHGHTWTDWLTGAVREASTAIETASLPLPWTILTHVTPEQ